MPFKKGQSGNPNGKQKGTKNRLSSMGIDPISALVIIKNFESWMGTIKGGRYYVYGHCFDGNVFYIGKGTANRAWEKTVGCRNDEWQEYVESINYEYDVKILACDLTEREALAVESAIIAVSKPRCNVRILFSQAV